MMKRVLGVVMMISILGMYGLSFGAAAKNFVVASNPTWPPMEFLDENKKIVGFDIDMMTAIGKAVGVDVKIKSTAWDGIFAMVENGEADVIASCVTITDARKGKYLFSKPYYEVRQALTVPVNSTIKGSDDLKGKKIGMQIGTTAGVVLEKMGSGIDVKKYDDIGLAYVDLKNGNLAGVMCDDPVARYYSSRKEGFANTMKIAFVADDVVEYIGFVASKSKPQVIEQINKGLEEIERNGEAKKIFEKWFGAKN